MQSHYFFLSRKFDLPVVPLVVFLNIILTEEEIKVYVWQYTNFS